jgi:tetratricopeptide (TPR) repeat protein
MVRPRRQLRSWLHVSDHPSWHHQPYYSLPLAHALANAYEQLHHAQQHPDPYFTAFRELVPFRSRRVCEQQRLNLEFALALAYTGDDSPPYALACLTSAWQIAGHLHDRGGQAEVGYLAGALWQAQGQLLDAYAVYQDALEALQRLARRDAPADPTLEFDLVVRLAGCAWELGWFPVCLRHLDEAYRFRAIWTPDGAEEVASLAWLDSQLARVLGQPARALNQAAAAADLLLTHGRPINGGRAHTILAESALDMLELTYAPTPPRDLWTAHAQVTIRVPLSRTDLLTQARKAAQLALEVAQDVHDPVGAMMARLATRRAIRLAHLQHGNESGVATAERLLRTARRLDDPSLLGRTEVALADELLAVGRSEAARSTYQRAMRHFEEYHLGGLAFWPRRALQQLADT